MGFANLEQKKSKFNSELMLENIQRLIDFDIFHCLLSGSVDSAIKAQDKLGKLPKSYLDWLKACDGGLLFDTVMLSSRGYDKDLDMDFDSYDDYNSEEAKTEFDLPEGYIVFAVRSYGDPICFSTAENDEKVYLWNVELCDLDDIWDTFEDWLTEEIDTGIELIADGTLEPLEVKLDGDDDE